MTHKKKIEIWFQNEARIGQKNGLVRQWARRGTRPIQPADQRYESAYLFGAICPARGVGAALALPFDDFVSEFNEERPHEARAMKTPAKLYAPSSKAYEGLPELEYPFHDRDILVTACGRICMARKKINVPTVLAGQRLGITEVDDGIWLVSFMHYDLG